MGRRVKMGFLLLLLSLAGLARAQEVPRTVEEAWARFDPRAEPLEVEVLHSWKEDATELRHVRYGVGTFEGKKTRVAAFYAFVTGLTLTPGNQELPSKIERVWQGSIPTFHSLRWVGGEFAPRPPPYLKRSSSK